MVGAEETDLPAILGRFEAGPSAAFRTVFSPVNRGFRSPSFLEEAGFVDFDADEVAFPEGRFPSGADDD